MITKTRGKVEVWLHDVDIGLDGIFSVITNQNHFRLASLFSFMLKNRFKRILVALDGSMHSRRGMNEAISLARQSEGSITGIYISPSFTNEPNNTLASYREYLLEKSRKFM